MVTTIEGLAAADGALHPMQQAFIDQDAFQCGYCTPGQIMSAVACVQEGHAGHRRRDPRIHERQSVPLRRLSPHRRRHPAGARCRRRADDASPSSMCAPSDIAVAAGSTRAARAADRARQAQFVAGGTTIVDLMKLDAVRPELLVDINACTIAPAGSSDGGRPAPRRARPHGRGRRHPRCAARLSGHRPVAWSSRRAPSCATWRASAATCCSAPAATTSATSARRLQQAQPGLRLRRARRPQPQARGAGRQRALHRRPIPAISRQALVALDAVVEIDGPRGAASHSRSTSCTRRPATRRRSRRCCAPGELITGFRSRPARGRAARSI